LFFQHLGFKVSLSHEVVSRSLVDVVGFAFLWFDERIREVCSRYARFTSGILPCGGANCIELGYLVSAKAIAVGQKSQIVGHAWLVWVDGFVLLGLCMIGVVVVNGVSNEVTMAGILAGLGGALFSAFAYNTIRRLKNLENPNVVVFYFPLITLPLSLMAYLLFDEAWRMPMGIEWFWLLMTGVTTQFGQFFMTRAYQSDKASNVSAISYAGIIWGAGFGVFLFDEKYQWLQYAGMALVLLGMFLNVRINLRREAAQ